MPLKLKHLTIILLLIVSSGLVRAQKNMQLSTPNYDIELFDLTNGLPYRDIDRLCADQNGLIWVLAPQGLYFYRGTRFERFDFKERCNYPHNLGIFLDVQNDQVGNLWIATNQGLVLLNPSRNAFIDTQNLGIPDSIRRNNTIHFDKKSNGDLLLFAKPYVYLYHWQSKFLEQITHASVPTTYNVRRLIYSAHDDIIYLPTLFYHNTYIVRNRQLEALDATHYEYVEAPSNSSINEVEFWPMKMPNDSVVLLCGPEGDKLHLMSLADKHFSISAKLLQSIMPEWDIVLNLSKVDPKMGLTPREIIRFTIRDVISDYSGAFWINTNFGIFHLRHKQANTFQHIKAFESKHIRAISQTQDNHLLVSANDELFDYNLNTQTLSNTPIKVNVWSLLEINKDEFWMLKEKADGFKSINPHTFQESSITNTPNEFLWGYQMARTPDNKVWVANSKGKLILYDIPTRQILKTLQPKFDKVFLEANIIKYMLYTSDHSLWITSDNGTFRYTQINTPNPLLDTTSLPHTVGNLPANDLYEDKQGNVWIATKGWGVYRYNPNYKSITNYSINNGLPNNTIYSIVGSHHDSLIWIGTQSGLSCLVQHSNEFFNYYQEDGLAQNEFNSNASHKSRDGYIYLGGMEGVTRFKPFFPAQRRLKLQCFVEVSISSAAKERSQKFFTLPNQTIQIYSSDLYIDFQIHNSELFETNSFNYRYKLSNESNDWKYLDHTSKITFINLIPGTYNLSIQSLSTSGEWSNAFSVVLQVNPPFYRTWWFAALILALIGLLIYIIFQIRLARVKREYAIREKISNDLHDSLGGRLYVLKTMATQISNTQNSPEEKKDLLSQFDTLCKDAIQTIRDFIWAFNPKNDNLIDLIERMEDFADNAVIPIVKQVSFHADDTQLNRRITPSIAHNYLMVYQEILTNMLKHTHSQAIDINITHLNYTLQINIINTHKGLKKPDIASEGRGQQSINKRLQTTDSRFIWNETPSQQHATIIITRL